MKTNYRFKKGYTPRMMKQWMFSIVLFTLLIPTSVWGQNKVKVTGSVFDTYNEPLVGAMVKVSEPAVSIGTYTGLEGQFSLEIKEGTKLEISFIGYDTQYVIAKNGMKIILKESSEALDEVIVVGYGTIKKSDLTGSLSSIASKDFLDQPASSAVSILSGRAPGVVVRKMSGNPNEGATIRIRGINSINGSNDPLIIVDGVESSMPSSYDIESIEILKDASATAIYGSRGANGVILVTTKKGTTGKPQVELFSNVSISRVTNKYDLMNAKDFADFHSSTGIYPFSEDELNYYQQNPNGTDWQDAIFRTGVAQDYKVVVSGGSKNLRYYISPHYSKATGTILNTQSESYDFKSKLNLTINSRIDIQTELKAGHNGGKNQRFDDPGSKTGLPLLAALVWSPTESIYEEDGSYNSLGIGTGTLKNPVLLTTPDQNKYSNWANLSGELNIKIVKGLKLTGKALIGFTTGGTRNFRSAEYNGTSADASQTSYENKNWLLNAFLTYNTTIAGKHDITVMGGVEGSKYNSQNISAAAKILPIESTGWYNLGLGSPNIEVSSDYSQNTLLSYFGRINYNYKQRYYVTANYRIDGSSKFRKENRFSTFPAFSLAWRLSEEAFMKNQDIFQNIKIRGGWGMTGSQAISSYSTYSLMHYRSYSWGTGVHQAGYYPWISGNADLKWETTKQTNIGIDLAFLNNKISVSLDYYYKKTVDLLAPISVPAYNGGDSQYGNNSFIANVGSVKNTGFEFNIDYTPISTNNVTYRINFNGATNNNKILSLGDNDIIYGDKFADGVAASSPFALIPGESIGTIYGMKYIGIWQSDEAEEAAKYGLSPGDYKYEDLNNDNSYSTDDYQVLGNTNPKFTWGLNNFFRYKNFDFNLLIEGSHGRDILNWTYMSTVERAISSIYTNKDAMNRWTANTPNAEFAKIDGNNNFNPVSSQYMEDASYVKIRNISLSYNIPRKIVSFADICLSVSAQNILTITKYKGYDPEISSLVGSDISSGMDWFAYPNPASISFGVAIKY